MDIKVGDYFDVYQEGKHTKRVISISDVILNPEGKKFCHAVGLEDLSAAGYIDRIYLVDIENEIENVIGNIYA